MVELNLSVKHFKSIQNLEFEIGNVNVLIGANGSGKSAILEAIGVLSAAISDRVDNSSLSYRGVRLGTPALYKSSFSNEKLPLTIELGVKGNLDDSLWNYKVNLNNPIEKPHPAWEYYSEKLDKNDSNIFGRSRATKAPLLPNIEIDKYKGLLAFLRGVKITDSDLSGIEKLYDQFKDYAIYTPNTATLRGVEPDSTQREPLGLFGGRLSEAIEELLDSEEDLFGTLDLDELYDLLDWVKKISVSKPTKSIVSPNVPAAQKVIRFTDRYMREGRNEITSYDASEGSLYVLFVLALAIHKNTPNMFSIDNFDQGMNPRLARAVTRVFCEQIIENEKVAFLTTHNPLVLDGLNLSDSRIRLFTVERNNKGYTDIRRVELSENLLKYGNNNQEDSLSRLWMMGRLGGVPNL